MMEFDPPVATMAKTSLRSKNYDSREVMKIDMVWSGRSGRVGSRTLYPGIQVCR